MIYYKNKSNTFAESGDFDTFYCQVLQIVKYNWKRTGNSILGFSDSKVSRLFSGNQKDISALIEMAKFMRIDFNFKMW